MMNKQLCYDVQSQEYIKLDTIKAIVQEKTGCPCLVQDIAIPNEPTDIWTNIIIYTNARPDGIPLLNNHQRTIALYGNMDEWFGLIAQLVKQYI